MEQPVDTRPALDELEVSLFGPGVGESIVLHLGDGQWVIVDSCRNPMTGKPVAVEYLTSMGFDPAEAVRAIIVTHWDADHIRGIGQVAAVCPEAPVWCTAAVGGDEVDALLDLEEQEPGATGGRLLELLKLRQARPEDMVRALRLAKVDTRLLQAQQTDALPRRQLWALSPSDPSVTAMLREFRAVYGDPTPLSKSVPTVSRNNSSVVLFLEIDGQPGVLLGADLEHVNDDMLGWRAAVVAGLSVPALADFIKIPHHGSRDAHCEDMWTVLLTSDPAGSITPFTSSGLPRDTDRDRIRKLTPNAYLTSAGPDDLDVDDVLLELLDDVELRRLVGRVGHVRWRRPLLPSADWTVHLDEASSPV